MAIHDVEPSTVLVVTGTWRDLPNLVSRIVITAASVSMSASVRRIASPTRMPDTANNPIIVFSITARWLVMADAAAVVISRSISPSVNR